MKYTFELSDSDVERLRTLASLIGDRGGLDNAKVTLTYGERQVVMKMVRQLPPEPIQDGIYTRVHNLSISTVFVKDNKWSPNIEWQDGSLVLPARVGPEAAEWTRVADLPDVNEWL